MGTGTNLFVRIFANVDSALSTYITDTVGNVIGYASPLFTSMMIVWIAMWGILMMFAKVDEPVRDGVFRIIRIGGIVALGLTVGTYMDVVVNVLQKGDAPRDKCAHFREINGIAAAFQHLQKNYNPIASSFL